MFKYLSQELRPVLALFLPPLPTRVFNISTLAVYVREIKSVR